MMKYIILGLVILSFYSCNREQQVIEKQLYKTQDIEVKKTYQNAKDKRVGNYKEKIHSLDGILLRSLSYRENKLDGVLRTYYEQGSIRAEEKYKGGLQNGLQKWYNEKGFLISEDLFLNGNPVTLKNFSIDPADSTLGYIICRFETDSSYHQEGFIVMDSNQQISNQSYYYSCNIEDTVSLTDTIKFEVQLFLNESDVKPSVSSSLCLGTLNSGYEVVDTLGFFEASNQTRKINAFYVPLESGYQIIQGIVELCTDIPDSLDYQQCNTFIFYKEVYISPLPPICNRWFPRKRNKPQK